MNRKLIVVFACLLATALAILAYLASITVPVRLKTLVVAEIEHATSKKALLQSIRFDIVRGVTLQDLVIYDNSSILFWAKDVSCGIPLAPLLARKVVVSSLRIDSPAIYVERRADNSFNIVGLLGQDYAPGREMALVPQKIAIRNGRVLFVDRTLPQPFKERIDNISLDVRLSLPAKITYALSCQLPVSRPVYVKSTGTYTVEDQGLVAVITAKDLSLDEFKDYYKTTGFVFPAGTVDASVTLRSKGGVLDADIEAKTAKLSIVKDNVRALLDATVKVMAQYAFRDKELEYAGKLDIRSVDIGGLETIGTLKGLRATVEFNDDRVWSENILVDLFGITWKARINVVNPAQPLCDVYAAAETRLSSLQKMLEERFGLKLAADIAGKADVNIALKMEAGKPAVMNGYVTLRDDTIALGSGNFPIEHISGEVQFTPEKLSWSRVGFVYRDTAYMTSGKLTDFSAPSVALEAASKDLSLRSKFRIDGKVLKVASAEGRYLNSAFAVRGELDFSDPKITDADLSGAVDIDLKDLRRIAKSSAGVAKMKPSGRVSADIGLSGDLKDLKACDMTAKAKSARLSLYGFEFTGVTADYIQQDGAGTIRQMRAGFYGGTLSASGKAGWIAKGVPYAVTIDARDVRLGLLKVVTGFKDKDVSGNIMLHLVLKGMFKDVSKLGGIGHLAIENGKLWQLNLFQGFGSLIFNSDFRDIVFTEGSCDFKIQDRAVRAEYIAMKSDIVNLYGSGTIGFDKSVRGVFKTELTEQAMYPGTQRNIAAAVGRYTNTEISGTLSDPKFKVKPSVPDIVAGVAGAIFQQTQ